jgi:hypothetical protein
VGVPPYPPTAGVYVSGLDVVRRACLTPSLDAPKKSENLVDFRRVCRYNRYIKKEIIMTGTFARKLSQRITERLGKEFFTEVLSKEAGEEREAAFQKWAQKNPHKLVFKLRG